MYQLYPYEEYAEIIFKNVIRKFNISKNNVLYNECYSRCAQAYIYTIYRECSEKHSSEVIRRYLYKIMYIYIICAININKEIKYICQENNLIPVDIDNYKV